MHSSRHKRSTSMTGTGTTAGVFLALGMAALAAAPRARADDLGIGEWIAELFGSGDGVAGDLTPAALSAAADASFQRLVVDPDPRRNRGLDS